METIVDLRVNQHIEILPGIIVTLVKVSKNKDVIIGVTAPKHLSIHRDDIIYRLPRIHPAIVK